MVGRTIIIFFFILNSIHGIAQKHPVLYGGFEYYRHTGFENDAFYNVNFGSQVYQWEFFAPEVGLNFSAGILPEREFNDSPDPNAIPGALYKASFTSFSISLAPKLKFGNEEAALVLIPEYNFGKLYAKGNYFLYNGNERYELEEKQKYSKDQNYWSFAAGIEGQLVNVDHLWFAFYLKYTRLNSKEGIESLDFSDYDFTSGGGSKDGIGLGIRVYYDLFSAL
ncbi:hypothetical protein GFO_2810 [Christiangramia forsetii KT0803]|uniref:Uncharacterized protein n=1 Tax=Christiangramia forsetii (strain DSM 17595 / CGMCC 1.15422 / KT0803) TaxID=411154 RepID=A0M569_CHRFK|nr:hypothetical protein GFO_2810 [Christiangramia forsetii KT0803]